jgi:hypothetical protein
LRLGSSLIQAKIWTGFGQKTAWLMLGRFVL